MTAKLTAAAQAPCPSCGGKLALVTSPDGHVIDLVWPAFVVIGVTRPTERARLAPFVACTVCEYCAEVR
jgi:hypothetical protein